MNVWRMNVLTFCSLLQPFKKFYERSYGCACFPFQHNVTREGPWEPTLPSLLPTCPSAPAVFTLEPSYADAHPRGLNGTKEF